MPRRLLLAAGCLVFLAFAAYGSFVPFHLERISIAEGLHRFRAVSFVDPRLASKTDLVANVLLFLPIGFTLAGVIAGRSRFLGWIALPTVGAFALAVSVGIEFGQVFMGGRTPSWNDILAETSGAIIGAIGWVVAGSRALDWLRPLAEPSTPIERMQRLLALYVFAWLVLQVLPLDLTLRLPELAEKYRAGRIVLRPFAGTTSGFEALVKFVSVAVPALPIGALGVVSVGAGRSRVARGALLGIAAVCALEALQVFVVTRFANVTDVISGAAGATAGAWIASRWMAAILHAQTATRVEPPTVRPWALVVLAGWIAVLVVRHWTPFDFVLSRELYETRIPRLFAMPFRSYYWANYLDALGEATTKILLGIPVGVLLQVFWPPARGRWRLLQAVVILAFGLAVFTTIELGQVFLPSRFPDDTDIVLGVLGAAVGLVAVRLVRHTR